tara:strand:- start:572 stop:1015 length:444 start_codon:yes stop_codon:yes gene_type:complete
MSYTERKHLTRILSIDYGDVRIGLAISDVMQIIAKPYKIIDNKSNEHVMESLDRIINEKNIEKIIVGLPLTLKNTFSNQTKKVEEFVSILKKKINIPILTYDERLTSIEAKRSLVNQGVKIKDKKGFVDMTAAAIFLQGYLDQNASI